MEKLGTVLTKRDNIAISSITLIGQIEGHYTLPPQNKTTKYEHLLPLLVSIEECADVHGVLLLLNTVGGDVEAGLAIAELISSMKKPTVSLVLGGGHSIGVPLAVAAKRSFIVPSATMTIHPVRMNGLVIGVEQSFSYFSKMQDRINRFITDNSGVKPEVLTSMMFKTGELSSDIGSIIDGNEAVGCGLIDKIGGLSDAIEELRSMVRESRPPEPQTPPADEPADKQEADTQNSTKE
ncbi:MAG: ClpP family protease [Eubacteriales bacterium]